MRIEQEIEELRMRHLIRQMAPAGMVVDLPAAPCDGPEAIRLARDLVGRLFAVEKVDWEAGHVRIRLAGEPAAATGADQQSARAEEKT